MSFYIPDSAKIAGNSSFARGLAEKIIKELPQFPYLANRLRIYSETDKYNWKEDESVWKQKRKLSPEEGEIYLDGEFISPYNAKDGEMKAYVRFLGELQTAYVQRRVFVHSEMYEIARAEKEAQNKPLEVPEARNIVEEIIVDNIKKSAKKRKRKVKMVK